MSNQPDQKKGMSGCAIAALIAGGLLVVGLVVVGAGMVWFMKAGPGKEIGQTLTAAANSTTGPAVDAMRAAGCTEAMSMDMSAIASMAGRYSEKAEDKAKAAKLLGLYQVSCVSSSLTCEQVAAAWGKAAPENASHAMVTVSATSIAQLGERTAPPPVCTGHYDRAGNKLADMDAKATQ